MHAVNSCVNLVKIAKKGKESILLMHSLIITQHTKSFANYFVFSQKSIHNKNKINGI